MNKEYIKTAAVFILFFILAVGLSFIHGNNITLRYITPIILLAITWLLYKKEGKGLSELGLTANRRNLYYLPPGLVIGALFFCTVFFFQLLHNQLEIKFNPHVSYIALLNGALFLLPGAITEELIFRGYCFKKVVDKAGIAKANVVFALLFMAWHWFALDAWGNYGLMLGLITTAFGHIFFATALMKSKTLYFPIAIHLGNNWVSQHIFSYELKAGAGTQPFNNSVFYIIAPDKAFSTGHVIVSYLITFAVFLLFTFLVLAWKRNKSIPAIQT